MQLERCHLDQSSNITSIQLCPAAYVAIFSAVMLSMPRAKHSVHANVAISRVKAADRDHVLRVAYMTCYSRIA